MFYSKQTNGFYDTAIHGDNIPSDAVEITDEQHQELMEGQSKGFAIAPDDNGQPILITRVSEPLTPEQIDSLRREAYANESDPLFFEMQRGEVTNEEWVAKIQEIKQRYPK